MAHIVTLRILVDEPDEARVYDGINEMLRAAQAPVDLETDDSSWIIDWSIGICVKTSEEINDSICNDTYVEGEAFVNLIEQV